MSENADNITENNYPTVEAQLADPYGLMLFNNNFDEEDNEDESEDESIDSNCWIVINQQYIKNFINKNKKTILIILCVVVLFFYFKGKKNTNITINVR